MPADAAADALWTTILGPEAAEAPVAATLLQRAWYDADARGDEALAWMAASAALLAIATDFADFRGLPTWIERYERGARAAPALPREIDRLRVAAARVALPTLDHRYDLRDPALLATAEGLFDALRDGRWPAGNEHALLAKVLYDVYTLNYEQARCERIAALVGAGLRSADPLWQLRFWGPVHAALAFWGHAAAAEATRRHIAALAAASPHAGAAWALALIELQLALGGSDGAAIERAAAQVDALRLRVNPGLQPRGLHALAKVQMQRGRPAAALERLDLVLQLCEDFAVPERDRGVYHELRAQALAALGRWDEAVAVVDALRQHQTGTQGQIAEAIAESLRTGAAWQRGSADAAERSCALLRRAAPFGWQRFLPYHGELAARICDAGLAAGVEVEFAQATVRARRLRPPEPWRADWPWRLRLRVLGPLQVERDGARLATGAKAQKKPLELLALLAAHGGRPLEVEAVIDSLWPSLEANAPRASLDMAVSRLRKLLDLPDAVQLAEGRLALDAAQVWTDVGAFEALAARVEAADAGDGGDGGDAAAVDALLECVRGPLLEGQALDGALRTRRLLLLQRFAALVQRSAEQRLASGDARAALRLTQRALLVDPLNEPLHRAQIAAWLALGERAEARRSFQRCEELLRGRLGLAPSAATVALAQRLDLS